mmetsp:Transcript_20176/g.71353  ORF Transcript_20176/g.71353 Transcript_20176/m.71353 type:complete len:301 (-) Transcript_20176:26-928(-)
MRRAAHAAAVAAVACLLLSPSMLPEAAADTTCGAGFFLNTGAGACEECPIGYFCVGGTGAAQPCTAGTFSGAVGAVSCEGCDAGYWCEEGATSATQHPCGSAAVYCPARSGAPITVGAGFYSFSSTSPDSPATRDAQSECGDGSYCVGGIRRPCPAGTFGDGKFLSTAGCSGPCAAGYYCPEGTTDAFDEPCGSPAVYCPAGSAAPLPVPLGFVSRKPVSGDQDGANSGGYAYVTNTASEVGPAEPGRYAVDGVGYDCAPGTFSTSIARSTPCSDLCRAGYTCHIGSASPVQSPCQHPSG